MAVNIKATIVKAQEDKTGKAVIAIEFEDQKGKWQKVYNFNQTTPIDFARFKEIVTADLRKDLNAEGQLTNISAQVGKQFTITI